jgi:hypothetical protein
MESWFPSAVGLTNTPYYILDRPHGGTLGSVHRNQEGLGETVLAKTNLFHEEYGKTWMGGI